MIVFELFLDCVLLSFVAFGGATALLPELRFQRVSARLNMNIYLVLRITWVFS